MSEVSSDLAIELGEASFSLDRMKLEEIRDTPQLDNLMSSLSFSFDINSLPSALENEFRNLKKTEEILLKGIYHFMRLQRNLTELDLNREKIAEDRDFIQEEHLKMKAEYLSTKEEFTNLKKTKKTMRHCNYYLMRLRRYVTEIQQDLARIDLRREVIVQTRDLLGENLLGAKAEYLSTRKEFMQRVVKLKAGLS
ncbi:hypothetical protein BVC80_1395g61 [Macleaya cordata]|uniref:Uncharacterized protein n=1 Tax=Macleaya cordata TaxID=56857 RepID=A0A200Q1J7_MACCD|nr:hypothetical protein BVC80_1395g61 [Macleaya cordata]